MEVGDGCIFTIERPVAFHETDMAGIVHFANFFKYFEEVESAYMRSIGRSLFDPSSETRWPRVHVSCDYRRPLHFGDVIEIGIRIDAVKERSIEFGFAVWKRTEDARELVATGRSVNTCASYDPTTKSMRSRTVPDDMLVAMGLARR
jgi:YbgC/YbaW family acyl-CoA thioester hydrolase